MFLLLLIVFLFIGKWIWGGTFVLLIVVFTFGGRNHNAKINIIRKQADERKEREKQEAQKIKEYCSDI